VSLRVEIAPALGVLRGGVQVNAVQVIRLPAICHRIVAAADEAHFEVILVDSLVPGVTAVRVPLKYWNLGRLDELGII
jgi:hypothetical protein